MGKLYAYDGSAWIEISKNGVDGKGFTGGSYSATTGKVTFTSNDGLGFVTGDLRGADGTDGTDGAAATVAVGTTTTGAPGTTAAVLNSGTSSAATFDFTIPAGSVWYSGAGAPAATHNNGDFYLNTSNGDVYKQTAGAWGSPIANLTGPQGSAGTASGLDTQVQFNDGGAFAGDSGLTYNKTTHALTATGSITGSNLSGTNTGDETATTIKSKLGVTTLSGSNTGDETATTIKSKLGITTLSGSNTGDQTTITGNAGSATKLLTARTINGVSFDGTANITVADDTKQPAVIAVSVATAYNTAAKIGTTASGSYTPTDGDVLMVTFANGSVVSNATLNIDGSGAKNIRVGGNNITTASMGLGSTTGSNIQIQMWYDGAHYQIYGAQDNTNTTYTAMTVSEGETGTATTSRTVRADYLQQIIQFYVDDALSTMNADAQYGWPAPTS